MLILSNSLTQAADEGSLKLATNLVKLIRKKAPGTTHIVTFERQYPLSDEHLNLNKFHISMRLISLLRKQKQPVLYIPFPAPVTSMALRIFLLSVFARRGLRVMMVRQYPMGGLAKLLLRKSRAELIVFSEKACDFYKTVVGPRVLYVKAGVDTEKFTPVSPEKATALKLKYGIDPERPVVLHVGHMKDGRNVAELMKIAEEYQVLLVVSTLAKERQNADLKNRLLQRPNIKILDTYLPNIEEIYQMCDVYFFPVVQAGHCIDVPLSCLEAAACDKPVVTTDYGEMQALVGTGGFYLLDDFNPQHINALLDRAMLDREPGTRAMVMEYDYENAIELLA